jgi:hypothetical protein
MVGFVSCNQYRQPVTTAIATDATSRLEPSDRQEPGSVEALISRIAADERSSSEMKRDAGHYCIHSLGLS